MKKLSYLFLAIIAMYITACGITPEIQAPLEDMTLPLADGRLDITFTDAKLNTDPSVVAASGDNVNVSLVIKKTPTSEKPRIMRVFVSDKANFRSKTDRPLFEIKLKNRDEQTQTIDFTVSATTGKNYLHFDVYDNNEKVTRKTLVINISADGQIASWVGIVLGAQTNALGSRVASATGDVYAQLGALNIPTTAQSIEAETGKIYAFLNGRNKKGLIKVNSIVGVADGTITFDIKVQK